MTDNKFLTRKGGRSYLDKNEIPIELELINISVHVKHSACSSQSERAASWQSGRQISTGMHKPVLGFF